MDIWQAIYVNKISQVKRLFAPKLINNFIVDNRLLATAKCNADQSSLSIISIFVLSINNLTILS